MSDRGEFDLIEWIRQRPQNLPESVIQPIGDDAAVLDPSFAHRLAVTSDMLLEDVHFRRHWTGPRLLGRKSLRVNLSDLAAMGAVPYGCLLNLGLPPSLKDDFFEEFIQGFLEDCDRYQVSLLGGDLIQSPRVFVCVTALGYSHTGELFGRSAAGVEDRLLLVGQLGLSRAGLEILIEEDPRDFHQIRSEDELEKRSGTSERFQCLKAHLIPEVYIQEAAWLQERALARAMIDVSDGLAADLSHILEESQLAAELQSELLPRVPGIGTPEKQLELILRGGEDYALVFTASREQLDELKRKYPPHYSSFKVIGEIKEGAPGLYLRHGNEVRKIGGQGFQHFR